MNGFCASNLTYRISPRDILLGGRIPPKIPPWVGKDVHSRMFITALLIIGKNWQPPKCPSIGDWWAEVGCISMGRGELCADMENRSTIYQFSRKKKEIVELDVGFPSGSICLQSRRCKFDHWIRKMPWRRAQQPTPVFLPGKSHGQRSLAGYSLWGHKELDMTEATGHAHTHRTECRV